MLTVQVGQVSPGIPAYLARERIPLPYCYAPSRRYVGAPPFPEHIVISNSRPMPHWVADLHVPASVDPVVLAARKAPQTIVVSSSSLEVPTATTTAPVATEQAATTTAAVSTGTEAETSSTTILQAAHASSTVPSTSERGLKAGTYLEMHVIAEHLFHLYSEVVLDPTLAGTLTNQFIPRTLIKSFSYEANGDFIIMLDDSYKAEITKVDCDGIEELAGSTISLRKEIKGHFDPKNHTVSFREGDLVVTKLRTSIPIIRIEADSDGDLLLKIKLPGGLTGVALRRMLTHVDGIASIHSTPDSFTNTFQGIRWQKN